MNWLTNFIRPKIRSLTKRSELPENLWKRCPGCEQMLFCREIKEHFFVCQHCGFHMPMNPSERLKKIFDAQDYQLLETPTVPLDPLNFKDQKRYIDRLKESKQKTQGTEAAVGAFGKVFSLPLVTVCFDFDFIGGSMGMAVGELLLMGAKKAIQEKAAFLTITASGGARMQEGILSLMQMPRSIIAINQVKQAGLPFFSLMTNPTTGGVAASFASLGDIILAEPRAIIGFSGARVIQETLKQTLPKGFQTAEFQKSHGFVDMIVERKNIKETLGMLMRMLLKK
jgi:acetyl-CoA carboxylase carboxyl transferase subunit beta